MPGEKSEIAKGAEQKPLEPLLESSEEDIEAKKDEQQESEKKKEEEEENPELVAETKSNTKRNALLYHATDDSLDTLNDSVDERLYYDDFDDDYISDMSPPISAATSPNGSPTLRAVSPPLKVESITDLLSATLSRSSSQLSLNAMSLSSAMPKHSKGFERRIAFDTTLDRASPRLSVILKAQHPEFHFRRNNKNFLVGFNNDSESWAAVAWVLDEMAINGDTIVVLQVLDEEVHHSIDRASTNKILSRIETLNKHHRKLSVVLEVTVGNPRKCVSSAIKIYQPSMLIVGTHHYEDPMGIVHGKETKHGLFWKKNSFSKHFLEESPIPVIVVKPFHESVEYLEVPIEEEDFFTNWLTHMDLSQSYLKKMDKRKKPAGIYSPRALSPSPSGVHLSRPVTPMLRQSANSSSESLLSGRSRSRGRSKEPEDSDKPKLLSPPSRSKGFSPTRTLSPFSKLFGKS